LLIRSIISKYALSISFEGISISITRKLFYTISCCSTTVILGIGCCIFEIAASSPRSFATKAERDFENYKELYDQNAELLNYINDNIVKEPTADNIPCISSLSYYPYSSTAERTKARIYYDVNEFEDIDLSTVEQLSLQDKDSIRKLMEDMSIGEKGTSFAHDKFRIELMHNTGVMFIKAPEEKKIYRGEYHAGFLFLDEEWQMVTYKYPPA